MLSLFEIRIEKLQSVFGEVGSKWHNMQHSKKGKTIG
jgi:hypothetical protein